MSDDQKPVLSYKGFDANLQCRGFQYAPGETFEHKGKVEACAGGFHACEYPLDVLRYYPPASSRFFTVEQSGQISRHGDDSKIASSKIKIGVELNLAGLIKAAVEYTMSRCKPIDPESPAYSTEENGLATASGTGGAATASGDSGAATASGTRGAATASGYSGAATASGTGGAATASGYSGAATASGTRGAATASGTGGAATASGYSGAATASGYSGAATASGTGGAATASGTRGAATAEGRHSAAMASGFYGKARGVEGTALFLVYRDSDSDGDEYGRIVHAKAVIVGQEGTKPMVFYSLNSAGEIVEAD
ncbi:DUF7666 domain-containing protein [Paraburkholderia phenoliruptrix]|uniref:DUF7666 domain-containing protein n=1 Tax=Paraburkholderia phenoliruptrix TaxID=252970 RepID=UPI002864E056|nr:hypothetical protein [Paraburkholderia phenoliruptrix]MDR6389181.1 hypothetical protein [Paraburkholderia phenoliruptrix]